jgi:hypothetical protein
VIARLPTRFAAHRRWGWRSHYSSLAGMSDSRFPTPDFPPEWSSQCGR